MSEEKIRSKFIWRPREFQTAVIETVDLTHPVGLEDQMYFYVGDDEDGNPILESVGIIAFETADRKKFTVHYTAEYDGPRENESAESAAKREQYLADKKVQEEADAAAAAEAEKEKADGTDEGEVESGADEEQKGDSGADESDSGAGADNTEV